MENLKRITNSIRKTGGDAPKFKLVGGDDTLVGDGEVRSGGVLGGENGGQVKIGGKVLELAGEENDDLYSDEAVRQFAHELNNLLDGSMRYTKLAQKSLSGLSLDHPDLNRANEDLDAANRGLNQIVDLLERWMGDRSYDLVEQYWQDGTVEKALNHAVHVLQPFADEMGTTLMTTVCEPARQHAVGPVGPLFVNAIKNAIEAAQHGGRVDVTLSYDGRDLIFEVRNDGAGLSAKLPRDEHGVVQSGNSTKTGGHGLGLSISRRLVESLGGKLWLMDQAEGGALLVARWHPPRGKVEV